MSESKEMYAERAEGPLSAIHLVESPRARRILAWGLASTAAIGLLALIVTPWQQTVVGFSQYIVV